MPDRRELRNKFDDTAKRLYADLESKQPSVPSEIVWAYQSEDVREAILDRLEAGETVKAVNVVVPDIVIRFRRVYFEFSSGDSSDLLTDGLLVQIDADNSVVQIIDPFSLTSQQKTYLAESEGVFTLQYSIPLQRTGSADANLNERFEEFVKTEGINRAFASMRQSFGGVGGVFPAPTSGTCVITTYEIATISKPGSPNPFPGTEGVDAREEEDDTKFF